MDYSEEKISVFNAPDNYYLAHCISSDCLMGAGIAMKFQLKFNLRNELMTYPPHVRKSPTCIKVGNVFNLITKQHARGKPTYLSLTEALMKLKQNMVDENIKYIAMPKIGSGLDKLDWDKVRLIIFDVFSETDITIKICYI